MVWPSSLQLDNTPLPAPERSRGAEEISSRLLGVWKKANPAPHSAMRHAMPAKLSSIGARTMEISPIIKSPNPMLPSLPAGKRSARRPQIGAQIAIAIGQGEIKRPVETVDMPRA